MIANYICKQTKLYFCLAYNGPTICTLNTLNHSPQRTQRLLFSATLTQDPEKLKFLKLFEPKLFTSIIKRKNTQLPTGNFYLNIMMKLDT